MKGRPTKARTRLGETIALRRREKGLTQGDVACRAEMAREVYRRIEMEPEKTSIGTFRKIAQALETKPSLLLLWAEKREATPKY